MKDEPGRFMKRGGRYFEKDSDGKFHPLPIQMQSWNPFKGGLYRSPKDLKFEIESDADF